MYVLWSVCGWVVDTPAVKEKTKHCVCTRCSQSCVCHSMNAHIHRISIPRIHDSMVSGTREFGVCGVDCCISCQQRKKLNTGSQCGSAQVFFATPDCWFSNASLSHHFIALRRCTFLRDGVKYSYPCELTKERVFLLTTREIGMTCVSFTNLH